MPLFEYDCEKCDKTFKIWKHTQPDAEHSRCPSCGKIGKQILGVASLHFLGSGFYETDYKNSEVALPSEDE